jgi:hypothetical protein
MNGTFSNPEGRRLSWWLLAAELPLLGVIGFCVSLLMFTLLPLSVAVLTFAVALLSFPIARSRFTAGGHVFAVTAAWLLSTIIFFFLIIRLGRAPFEWLLDWG